LFNFHEFVSITLEPPLDSDVPAVDIALGAVTVLIVATLGGWLFTRLLAAGRWGVPFVAVVLLAAVSLYSWLVRDDPEIVVAPGRLRPTAGVRREPRELFLEGTGGKAFGPLAGGSGEMDAPESDQLTEEWLRQHSSEIHARWEQFRPVRDWVGQLDRFEGFDDYFEFYDSPLLAYRPLRRYFRAARDEAFLAALEGRYADAAEIEGQALSFGKKLRNGSRCLVHLMIGTFVEKGALESIQILVARYPPSARAYSGIAGLVQSPGTEWDDLERVFLNDVLGVQAKFSGPGAFGAGLAGRIKADACAFLFNRNATAFAYGNHLLAIAAACRRSDFASAEAEEGYYARLRMQLRFKNFLGPFVLNVVSPNTAKITRELDAMIKLREQLAAKLQAKRAPEANASRAANSESESSTVGAALGDESLGRI
jgi:hypothetical protein